MEDQLNFVAISGSLRKGSYNTMVLHTLQKLAPPNMSIEQLSIADVPVYNFDLFDKGFPPIVENLNDRIKAADGVIIVTPEYNHSIPGGLKNVIDIISRSPKKTFDQKPVGILGASPGLMGTVRSQDHLRQVLISLNAYVLDQPEIMISQVHTKFDEAGNLTDELTTAFLKSFITSLAAFTLLFKQVTISL